MKRDIEDDLAVRLDLDDSEDFGSEYVPSGFRVGDFAQPSGDPDAVNVRTTNFDRLMMASRPWDLEQPSPASGGGELEGRHSFPVGKAYRKAGLYKAVLIQHLSSEWNQPSDHYMSPQNLLGISLVHDEPIDQRFSRLEAQWEEDTAFVSSAHEFVLHPAYLEIIGMGLPALPFIFRRLSQSPAPWFPALRAIVGFDPGDGAPDADAALTAWIDWGRAHGYVL